MAAKRILQELPKGSVKIPFGELRQAVPPGTFSDNVRHDQMLVELPLNEILMRLHPSMLSRRANQKQIHIAPEITNVFGPHGEGMALSTPPVNVPKPVMVPPLKHVASGDTSISMRNFPKPTPVLSTTAAPIAVAFPALRIVENESQSEQSDTVRVALALLCESWPEMVRVEIRELNLLNKSVALPLDKLEQALKAGKIIFTWKQICNWMQPKVENPSGAEDMPVELPLKIVAPLFMAKHRPKIQKIISVVELPDLFTGKIGTSAPHPSETIVHPAPIVLAAPAPLVMVAETLPIPVVSTPPIHFEPMAPSNGIKLAITSETFAPEIKPNILGEMFGQPAKQDWSPKEVVENLAALPGIAGVFVAMQDGLLVAAKLPTHLKADTVAAFLPQIFGRMNQYTRELQIGSLSSLSFVAENVSWQIVKCGTVYLGALGQPGENLPGSKLNSIAAEVGRQIQ
ncbi:MAG: roadblock/LC7 domain-containing protein [Verrucomicrobiota bacterium]